MTNPAEKKLLYCKKCGDTVRKWFDRQVFTGYFCNNCGMQQDFRYKDTAAEKIRQVVEGKANSINENESYFPSLESARSHVANVVVPVLDAIIEEMEKERDALLQDADFHAGGPFSIRYQGAADGIDVIIKSLKEARSSLDSGCTSITNSTHE